MLFDTGATQAAEASLDALWMKTQVISNNMANIDTPNFKASTVSFEQVLSGERAKLSERSAEAAASDDDVDVDTDASASYRTTVTQHEDSTIRVDGNNVSLEEQQAELWQTYAQYSYLLDRISGHYQNIGTVISNMRG